MTLWAQAALRAALEGLQISGGVELNVPAGRMATPLMRHQRLALAWMLQRERRYVHTDSAALQKVLQ